MERDEDLDDLRYLTGPKGSVLMYPGTDDPVFIAGTDQRILCLGTSKSISSIMLFRNAISKVHSKYRIKSSVNCALTAQTKLVTVRGDVLFIPAVRS
jgi:hypothetical protein